MSDVWTPPSAPLEGANSAGHEYAVDMRERHIAHETSVKSIGTLYYFVTGVMIIGAVAGILSTGHFGIRGLIVTAVVAGLSALLLWLGRGIKQLKSWAKVPAGVLSGIGLIGFPVWTLINGYILYLLFSEKGAVVFSEEYKQIIADTPGIKSRTPMVVWIILIVLVAAMVLAIVTSV